MEGSVMGFGDSLLKKAHLLRVCADLNARK